MKNKSIKFYDNSKIENFIMSRGKGLSDLIRRLEYLYDFYSENTFKYNEFEAYKLIPVAIVSAHEAFFQKVISKYIDSSESYLINGFNLIGKNPILEIDKELLINLNQKKHSLGDLIALSCKYGKSTVINCNLNTIFGEKTKFYDRLKSISVIELIEPSHKIYELYDFLQNPGTYFIAYESVFDLRHKYIHEFMSSDTIELTEALDLLKKNIVFLKACRQMVWSDLYSDSPLTFADMVKHANNQNNKENERILQLLKKYYNNLNTEQAQKLKNLFKNWEKSSKQLIKFFSELETTPGNINHLINITSDTQFKELISVFLNENLFRLDDIKAK